MSGGYYKADVDEAERKIKAAFPAVEFDRLDYGYRLVVNSYKARKSIIVFQPRRDNIGQPQIVTPLAEVFETLKSWGEK